MPNKKSEAAAEAPKSSGPAGGYKIELNSNGEILNDADLNYRGELATPYPDWLEEAITEGRVYTPGFNRADLRKPSFAKTRQGDVPLSIGSTIAPDGDSYFLKAWTASEYNVEFEGGTQAAPSQIERPLEEVRSDPDRMKPGQGDTSIQGSQSPPSVPPASSTTDDLPMTDAKRDQEKAIADSNAKVDAAAAKKVEEGQPGLADLNAKK